MTEVLTQEQINSYEKDGYLVLENRIPPDIVAAIHSEIARFEDEARSMKTSNDRIDLEDTHSPDTPRLRRIKFPHLISEVVNDLMRSDHVLAPVRDLLGPNLRLHTTKLNMKSAGYGAAVEWHQDFAFYPHTNDDLLAVGVLLDDMVEENGPLMVFPGTHRGPIFDHHADGVFVGAMDLEACGLNPDQAVSLTGQSGSITLHHARIVHGSALNTSSRDRRLLFYEVMAADAFPIMGSMTTFDSIGRHDAKMLCGAPTLTPRLKEIPVRIPQPQPAKAGSIYEVQSGTKARSFKTFSET